MRKLALIPVLLLLFACAVQQTLPQSFDQRLSASADQLAGAYQSIAANVAAHRMSGAEGQEAIAIADKAKLLLGVARGATDPTTAEGQLILAANVLRELQTYLARTAK